MNEIIKIFEKYEVLSFDDISQTDKTLNHFLIEFSKDLSRLIDVSSRLINNEVNPNYYNLNESTIVGSITRIVKLYLESIYAYEQNKLEIFSQFTRPLYESFIITKYLIKNGDSSQTNFRLVSYRARFSNYKTLKKLNVQDNSIINRQLLKLESKLKVDGFKISDLETEDKKGNKAWKLDGKSFWKIHSEVDNEKLYSFIYGVGSDAVHGSWQEIFDFHLTRQDGGFTGFLNYENCDCRVLVPLNSIIIESIEEFLEWNKGMTETINNNLKNFKKINLRIYQIWEEKFGEKLHQIS